MGKLAVVWAALSLIVTALGAWGIVSPQALVYERSLVFRHGNVWRIFTAAFFGGKLDFRFIVSVFFEIQFMSSLERHFWQNRPSVMFFMVILFMLFIGLMAAIVPGYQIHGGCYTMAFCQIFGKLAGEAMVNVVVIPIQARWLPLAYLVWDYVMGGWLPVIQSAVGAIAAHIVFCLLFVWPPVVGRPLLRVPPILVELCDGHGEAPAPRPQGQRIG